MVTNSGLLLTKMAIKTTIRRLCKNAAYFSTGLTKRIWLRKYSILREIYGFEKDSWEIQTTPREEAFWQFTSSFNAKKWLNNGGVYR